MPSSKDPRKQAIEFIFFCVAALRRHRHGFFPLQLNAKNSRGFPLATPSTMDKPCSKDPEAISFQPA